MAEHIIDKSPYFNPSRFARCLHTRLPLLTYRHNLLSATVHILPGSPFLVTYVYVPDSLWSPPHPSRFSRRHAQLTPNPSRSLSHQTSFDLRRTRITSLAALTSHLSRCYTPSHTSRSLADLYAPDSLYCIRPITVSLLSPNPHPTHFAFLCTRLPATISLFSPPHQVRPRTQTNPYLEPINNLYFLKPLLPQ